MENEEKSKTKIEFSVLSGPFLTLLTIACGLVTDPTIIGFARGLLLGLVLWMLAYTGLIPIAGPFIYWYFAWRAVDWIYPGIQYVILPIILGLVVTIIISAIITIIVVAKLLEW